MPRCLHAHAWGWGRLRGCHQAGRPRGQAPYQPAAEGGVPPTAGGPGGLMGGGRGHPLNATLAQLIGGTSPAGNTGGCIRAQTVQGLPGMHPPTLPAARGTKSRPGCLLVRGTGTTALLAGPASLPLPAGLSTGLPTHVSVGGRRPILTRRGSQIKGGGLAPIKWELKGLPRAHTRHSRGRPEGTIQPLVMGGCRHAADEEDAADTRGMM